MLQQRESLQHDTQRYLIILSVLAQLTAESSEQCFFSHVRNTIENIVPSLQVLTFVPLALLCAKHGKQRHGAPRMHLTRAELKDLYVSSYCVGAIITPCSKLQMASVGFMVVVEWRMENNVTQRSACLTYT